MRIIALVFGVFVTLSETSAAASWWCATNFIKRSDQLCRQTREACEALNTTTMNYVDCREVDTVTIFEFTQVNGGRKFLAFPLLSQCERERKTWMKNKVDFRDFTKCYSSQLIESPIPSTGKSRSANPKASTDFDFDEFLRSYGTEPGETVPPSELLTCTKVAFVQVENDGENVEVKQPKESSTFRAFLVVDRAKQRIGIGSTVEPELVYTAFRKANATTIHTADGNDISACLWAIDLKGMRAVYARAAAVGETPGFRPGFVSGKVEYFKCQEGWPPEMLSRVPK